MYIISEHIISEVWNYLQSVPSSTWSALGGYLLASGAIATLLQVLKRKFDIDSKHVITSLLGLLSFVASSADYILSNSVVPPVPGIAHIWAYLLAGAIIVHRFAVSPAFTKIEAFLKDFATKVDAEQSRQATKSTVTSLES